MFESKQFSTCLLLKGDNQSIQDNKIGVNRPKFVEIGTYSVGAVFGLGEPMDDRAVAANNAGAQCLLLPRQWLLQNEQNLGNVWQRCVRFVIALTSLGIR